MSFEPAEAMKLVHLDHNCSNFTTESPPSGPDGIILCDDDKISEMAITSEFPVFLQVAALIIGVPVITLGLIGNMLTLLTLKRTPVLQTPANVFLISLSISDIFHCTIVIPIQITVYMHGGWPFGMYTFCNIYPFLNLTFVGATMGVLSATALGRHFKIIYPSKYARFFNRRSKTTTIVFFCWLLPMVFQIPPLFGLWGEFGYEEKLLTCALLRGDDINAAYGTFFIFSTLVLPIGIIVFSYLRIFCVVRANHRRVQIMRHSELITPHRDSQQKTSQNKVHREDIRFTKMMMCIFLVCIVCYFPYLIVNITDRNVDNLIAINFASICIWFSACLNPVVYVLMNRHFRKAFMKLLPKNSAYPFEVTQ